MRDAKKECGRSERCKERKGRSSEKGRRAYLDIVRDLLLTQSVIFHFSLVDSIFILFC